MLFFTRLQSLLFYNFQHIVSQTSHIIRGTFSLSPLPYFTFFCYIGSEWCSFFVLLFSIGCKLRLHCPTKYKHKQHAFQAKFYSNFIMKIKGATKTAVIITNRHQDNIQIACELMRKPNELKNPFSFFYAKSANDTFILYSQRL